MLAEKDMVRPEYAEHGIAPQLIRHFGSQAARKPEAFKRGISSVSSICVVEVLAKLGKLAKETQCRPLNFQHLGSLVSGGFHGSIARHACKHANLSKLRARRRLGYL